jgi:hypothetical protein
MARKAKVIKIKKWLVKGEFDGSEKNSAEVIESAGNALDGVNSHDILGRNVFQSTDGKFYQVQVQAQIIPLTKKEAEEIIAEETENAEEKDGDE